MNKLFTLFAFLAVFMGAKAEEIVDAYIDFSTVTEIPSFGWGSSESALDRLSLQDGCLHFHSTEATDPTWDCQWFPIGMEKAPEVGVTYTLHFKVKGDHNENITAIGFGQSPYGQFPITTDWVEGTFDYDCISADGNLLFQAGGYVGDFDIAYLKITHDGVVEKPATWKELLVNGDAEKSWEELGLADVAYDDMENNYKVCFWTKEKGVNMDADGAWNPFPAEIIEEVGGNHAFICRATTADTEGDAAAWDNQIWLQSPRAWKAGEEFKLSFRYKASEAVKTNTQYHNQTPLDYLHWQAIGDIDFTTEWQTFEKEVIVPTDANGMWSIAFNLNPNVKTPVDFYIDDISWSEMELEHGLFVTAANTETGNVDYDFDSAIEFVYDEDMEAMAATVGTKGKADTWVNEVMISTVAGNARQYKANTIKAKGVVANEAWTDYEDGANAKIKLPSQGVWNIYVDTEAHQFSVEWVEGDTPKDPIEIVANPTEFVIKTVERAMTQAEGMDAGFEDGSDELAACTGQPWDNQFFLIGDRALEVGEEVVVAFDYMAETVAQVGTWNSENAGGYLHYEGLGNLEFTTDWQHFEKTIAIPGQTSGKQNSWTFNLSNMREANVYHIKNVKFYLADMTETLIDMETENPDNFQKKIGANTGAIPTGMTEVGTCVWYITSEGELVIAPADGESGDLPEVGWEGYWTDEQEMFIANNPWYEYSESIFAIKILPGVKAKSCSAMFCGLNKAKSADLSGLNTENATRMDYMFGGCSALTSLDLSNFNTQNVTDMNDMFGGCSLLTSLDLSNFDTEKVTHMGWMFWRCNSLVSLNISSFNTQNVKSTRSMFSDCISLASLDVSNFDTQNVENMDWTFRNCASLTSLDTSHFNTEKATTMWGMFAVCSSLTSLDLSSFNTQNVTNMASMFTRCSSLTSLDLSNFNTEKVTDMQWMFNMCSSLTELDLSGFNMQNVTNISDMFTECPALNTIISNRKTPSPLKVGTFDSFANRENCTLLVPIGTKALYAAADGWNELGFIEDVLVVIPEDAIAQGEIGTCVWYITSEGELVIAPADGVSGDLPENGWTYQNDNDGNLFYTTPWYGYWEEILSAKILSGVNATSCSYMFADLDKVASIDISGLNTQNVTSMSGMFYDCSSLTSLDLSNLNTQNVTSMDSMFFDCISLTSLDLSNFNTQNVTSMSGMFDGCSSLTSLDLSNFNTQNVRNMSYMFWGCSSLTSLDLSNFNTQNVKYMNHMFSGCSSLASLDLSNFDTQNVTYMSNMFRGCSALTSLDLSNFNTQNVTDMHGMFYGCSSLTSLDLSNFDTQNVTSMSGMFYDCSSLTSLDLSNFNTENVTSMGGMFFDCISLTSLDLSNFNTQNVTSMSGMFDGCSSLTSLDLSNFDTQKVTEMGSMFASCSSLTSLDLSNFDTKNVTNMASLFSNCRNLISLNLTNFDMQNVTNWNNIFDSTVNLETVISDNEAPSILQAGMFSSLLYKSDCTLLVPEGTETLYAAADGWNELGQIKAMNEYLFGDLVASVSQEENIATDALKQLQLTYPNSVVGKPGFENCVMSDINMEMALTLMDSMSEIIEESYALTIDSIGTVEFTTNLKRGETYTVEVPRGLYIIYNNDKEFFSPAATLTYTTDYILGDVNDDKQHSVTDIVGVVSYIMKGSEQVGKLVVDCNIDEMVNIADASFLVEKIITGEFPTVAPAKARLAAAKVPQLQLMETGDVLALSFDGSNDYCSMQFDVTLKDDCGNDITSTDNLRITSAGGLNGHNITTGMVDGKLRVLVYSINNSAFSLGDILTVETEAGNDYMVSITDAVIVTTGFASVYPDDVDKDVSMADGIKELSADDGTTDIYDITGRKLNEVPKKGIFIIGGKKIMK